MEGQLYNNYNNSNGNNGPQLTPESKAHLFESAKWAKFISIVGFVALGLFVLVGLIMLAGATSAPSHMEIAKGFHTTMGITYLIMAVLYFFPVYFTYMFASRMKAALAAGNTAAATEAFANLKNYYKFSGILMIVALSLLVLGLILFIASGMAMQM